MNRTLNFILFQLCWFGSVLGAIHGYPLLGPVLALLAAGICIRYSDKRQRELLLLALCCLLGTAGDLLPLRVEAFFFLHGADTPWGYPLWMSALWLAFGTTLRSSLSWLSTRYSLAALFGLIGGPLAYYAGESLGAISLGAERVRAFVIIAVFWGGMTPLLFLINNRLVGGNTR